VIAKDFLIACRDELVALKPGNVHVFGDGHGMTVDDFMRSAEAAAPEIARPGASLGERVLGAVRATREAVGQNTNLGILLLCAPLAMAGERDGLLHRNLRDVLAESTVQDADLVFQGIVLASPAGLGEVAQHDVRSPATVTLKEAMREAADRDSIARLYAEDFAPLFHRALPAFYRTLQRRQSKSWAVADCYLRWLALWPDSHIVRKYGHHPASAVQGKARLLSEAMERVRNIETVLPQLRDWDSELKSLNLNPGTSADLTVATVFAWQLRSLRELPYGV
jgi:triphosphoribosyl-dephospho-CoA synthase